MRLDIITLFPQMFPGPFAHSIVKRAQEKKLVEINLHDLRKWAVDARGSVDDRPYGGGGGMILRVEPIYEALQEIKNPHSGKSGISAEGTKSKIKTVLLDPRGEKFTQAKARQFAKLDQLIIVCGHYEGVDERVHEHLVDESLSIGDYILTGGEIAAMVVVDAVTRLIPTVLEKPEAVKIESFSDEPLGPQSTNQQLEYPQYTRPETFHGWKVPKVLLSGNHEQIKKWRFPSSGDSTWLSIIKTSDSKQKENQNKSH